MHVLGADALSREVHVVVVVTIPAFQRVVRLETLPFVAGELESFRLELLRRIHGSEDLAPYLF